MCLCNVNLSLRTFVCDRLVSLVTVTVEIRGSESYISSLCALCVSVCVWWWWGWGVMCVIFFIECKCVLRTAGQFLSLFLSLLLSFSVPLSVPLSPNPYFLLSLSLFPHTQKHTHSDTHSHTYTQTPLHTQPSTPTARSQLSIASAPV